jgi:hypothetical protein
MASTAVPERIRWAVETLDPGPDDHLLEIGCGPGLAITPICERLVCGRIVAIDRSATAISRAERRNAEHVAAGRAVLRTVALEALDPSEVLAGRQRFDKGLRDERQPVLGASRGQGAGPHQRPAGKRKRAVPVLRLRGSSPAGHGQPEPFESP